LWRPETSESVLVFLQPATVIDTSYSYYGNDQNRTPGVALDSYPALFASRYPIVVVGAVQTSGIYATYSKGLASELTVSVVGSVHCAHREGGITQDQGTSFGETLSIHISSTSDMRI